MAGEEKEVLEGTEDEEVNEQDDFNVAFDDEVKDDEGSDDDVDNSEDTVDNTDQNDETTETEEKEDTKADEETEGDESDEQSAQEDEASKDDSEDEEIDYEKELKKATDRNNTLNGIFKKEKSELTNEVEELRKKVEGYEKGEIKPKEEPKAETKEVEESEQEQSDPELDALLSDFDENYEDIAKPVKALLGREVKAIQTALPKAVQEVLAPLIPTLDRLIEDYNDRAVNGFQSSVKKVHADYDETQESEGFKEWMAQQPQFMQDSFNNALKSNVATDTIYVLDLYKKSIGGSEEETTPAGENEPEKVEKTETKTDELAEENPKADLLEAVETKKASPAKAVMKGGKDNMSFDDAFAEH